MFYALRHFLWSYKYAQRLSFDFVQKLVGRGGGEGETLITPYIILTVKSATVKTKDLVKTSSNKMLICPGLFCEL